MPAALLVRLVVVTTVSSVLFEVAAARLHANVPWWASLLIGIPVARITIAWYRRKHRWPY